MKHLSTRSLITPRTELSSLFLTGAADGVRQIKRPFLAIIPPRPREVLLRAVYDLNLVHPENFRSVGNYASISESVHLLIRRSFR
jgi:hypothetical protein